MELTYENIKQAKQDMIEYNQYRKEHELFYKELLVVEIPKTFKEKYGYEIQLEPFDLIGKLFDL